jgi:acetamidase/formamidase
MSNFSKKIRTDIVDPAQSSNRANTFHAKITEKSSNLYTVEFQDEKGEKQTKSGVKVRVYGNDSVNSFKVGDTVTIECENSVYTIISVSPQDYDQYKADYELKSDVYSNLVVDFSPGNII